MKYPMINKQPRREVNVPKLSGGLNLRDSLTGVRDNQLTDCVNMWYKDGMLKTRPAIKTYSGTGYVDKFEKFKIFSDITKDEAVLVSTASVLSNGSLYICFYWQGKSRLINAGEIYDYTYSVDDKRDYFVVEKDGILYCFTTKGNIYKCDYYSSSTSWEMISDDEIYVPIVYAHCQRSGWDDFEGTQFEGYNLLTNRYKMIYSAYNKNDSNSTHPMRYALGQELPEEGEVSVEITSYDSEKEELKIQKHVITYTKSQYDAFKKGEILIEKFDAGTESEDGLYLFVKYNYVGFLYQSEFTYTNGIATVDTDDRVKKYGCSEDNVVIIAPINEDKLLKNKVFGMTKSTWFGGASNGINNGSRLFLYGNTEDNERALVIWSGLNNPLYFPENNYAYVGNKAQPVTAFGQQGENLIIFKPNETYYSYYAQNTDITADDLVNQVVIDYESNSVYFPMVTLHSAIGCDCPDTVQLCRNRLVWLNSDGKVYTLVSANQYSEMSIYSVSGMIERKLKTNYNIEQLKTATSHDFEGYYVLMIGNDACVMDYNSYGYTHVYSYSKTEDANCLIPWYYWRFSVQDENVKFYGFKDFLFSFYDQSGDGLLTFCVLSCGDISEKFFEEKIVSSFQTKLFEFSAGHYLKNVDRVSVSFGNNDGAPIKVSFVSNVGSESDTVVLDGAETDEREAAFVTVKNFYPTTRAVRTFGVKIECEGKLCVDGLSMQYRLLGGVK